MSEKLEDIQLDLQEDHQQRKDREAKSPVLSCVTENQGLDLVKGWTPSKTKRKAVRVGAGNVEAPAPNDTEKNKQKKQRLAN
jgi:hypothetical protein